MTPHVETILAAVEAAITGLATTGSNVFRGEVDALAADQVPGLCLFLGDNQPVDRRLLGGLDFDVEIFIDIHVAEITEKPETAMNAIWREVVVALAAAPQLGLAFVYGLLEVGAGEPELAAAGDRPTITMRLTWLASYGRSETDPGS